MHSIFEITANKKICRSQDQEVNTHEAAKACKGGAIINYQVKKVGKGKEGKQSNVLKTPYYKKKLAFKPNHAQSARSFSFILMFPFQNALFAALMNFIVLTLPQNGKTEMFQLAK